MNKQCFGRFEHRWLFQWRGWKLDVWYFMHCLFRNKTMETTFVVLDQESLQSSRNYRSFNTFVGCFSSCAVWIEFKASFDCLKYRVGQKRPLHFNNETLFGFIMTLILQKTMTTSRTWLKRSIHTLNDIAIFSRQTNLTCSQILDSILSISSRGVQLVFKIISYVQ